MSDFMFEEQTSYGKTKIWKVQPQQLQFEAMGNAVQTIGKIRWDGGSASYAFFPEFNTVYLAGQLRQLASFCEEANARHRKKGRVK